MRTFARSCTEGLEFEEDSVKGKSDSLTTRFMHLAVMR